MKRILILLLGVLLLTGCAADKPGSPTQPPAAPEVPEETEPVVQALSLDSLLTDIQSAAPGSAGASLKQARAAGEFLDWVQSDHVDDSAELERWLSTQQTISDAELALAWAAVLDDAERILDRDKSIWPELEDAGYTLQSAGYDDTHYLLGMQSLSSLFSRLLDNTADSGKALVADYDSVTLERLTGMWVDREAGELLIFTGDRCRVFAPALNQRGEYAFTARIRDRSAMGYCPALEIDWEASGAFSGALAYYVTAVGDNSFWCATQGQCFRRLG